jgi:probable HAF family extracellular repeat protein
MQNFAPLSSKCVLVLLCAASVAPAAAAQVWLPSKLDTNGATSFGGAFAINETGTAVGFAEFIGGPANAAAIWTSSGTALLPVLVGDDVALALDVNAAGTAVGTSTDLVNLGPITQIFDHPVVWSQGVATDVRTLVTGGAALELLSAVGIDDAGRIIGRARTPGGVGRGFLLENGIVVDIGDLGGPFPGTEVHAIGEDGSIVGASTASTTFPHAIVWQNGVVSDLHDFAQMPGRVSHAYDVNNRGVVCGSGDFVADFLDYEEAVVFDNGTIVRLGTLAGSQPWAQAFAFGINDLGHVVGATNLPTGEPRAFIWRGGVMQDLNRFLPSGSGWVLTSAEDINNDGRIVGQGIFNGVLHAFVLVPDGQGTFTPYGTACVGGGGLLPQLANVGLPAPGFPFALEVKDGAPFAFGAHLIGLGQGALPLTPSCDLSIAPFSALYFPVTLDASGSAFTKFNLAKTVSGLDLTIQSAFLDVGAPDSVSATNALRLVLP